MQLPHAAMWLAVALFTMTAFPEMAFTLDDKPIGSEQTLDAPTVPGADKGNIVIESKPTASTSKDLTNIDFKLMPQTYRDDQQLDAQMGIFPSTPQAPGAALPAVKIAPTALRSATERKPSPAGEDPIPPSIQPLVVQKPGMGSAIRAMPPSIMPSANTAVGQKITPQITGQQMQKVRTGQQMLPGPMVRP